MPDSKLSPQDVIDLIGKHPVIGDAIAQLLAATIAALAERIRAGIVDKPAI